MYTVKELYQAMLACKTLIEFLTLQQIIFYLCRTCEYTEEERFAIEAALLVKKRTFRLGK